MRLRTWMMVFVPVMIVVACLLITYLGIFFVARMNFSWELIFSSVVTTITLAFGFIFGIKIKCKVSGFDASVSKISNGDLTVSIDVSGRDEFTQMNASLKSAINRLKNFLAGIVESSRTLTRSSEDLKEASDKIDSLVQQFKTSYETN